jgi:hypothetical protein
MRRLDFWKSDWFLGIIVALWVLIVANGGLIQGAAREAYDLAVPAPSRTPSDRIAVAGINDQGTAKIGHRLSPREVLVQLMAAVMLLAVGCAARISWPFLLAKRGREPSDFESAQDHRISRIAYPKQDPLGATSRMSPEQLAGKKIEGRSNLFSLGVARHRFASGRLPAGVAAIVNQMLAKYPGRRYPDGQGMARALRLFVASLVPVAKLPATTNA